MKKYILFILSFCSWSLYGQMQNQFWAFPNKYIDFKNNIVKSFTNNSSKINVSNGLFGSDGTLKFYISSQNSFIDRNNTSYDNYSLYVENSRMLNEFAIIPRVNYNNQYYILSYSFLTNGSGIYELFYGGLKVNNDGSLSTFLNNSMADINGNLRFSNSQLGVAQSYPYLKGNNTQSDVYVVGNVDGQGKVKKIIFNHDNNSLLVETSTAVGTNFENTELDMSFDNVYLAWGTFSSNSTEATLYLYNTITQTLYSKSFVNTNYISGVEFDLSNKRLYFSMKKPDSNSGIYYMDISSGNLNNTPQLIQGTSLYYNSQLEMASDYKIYFSNGTHLHRFDPNVNTPIIETNVYTVTNPQNVNGIYTLVDQIDGADYTDLHQSYSCKPYVVYNTHSSIPTLTKAAKSIINVNDVKINSNQVAYFYAGEVVSLKPGFKAETNSTFKAAIGGCYSGFSRESVEDMNEAKDSNIFTLFPNPNSGSFTVSFPDASASYEVKVSDVLGNLVFSDVATELASKEFTLPNVSNGLYIVDVKGGGTSYKQKVQVLK